MEDSIEKLMFEEHSTIKKILEYYEELVNSNLPKANEQFSKFKWVLEKHFFVEEKAIFVLLNKIRGEEQISDIFNLMQEHGSILELVNNIEEGLKNNVKPNITGLKMILSRHANFEDAVFYPNLDQLLNQQQKEEIIERVKEVIQF